MASQNLFRQVQDYQSGSILNKLSQSISVDNSIWFKLAIILKYRRASNICLIDIKICIK